MGVLDYFSQKNISGFHVENYLWISLFGLLFWEELFEKSSVHGQFERTPHELITNKFYEIHKSSLEEKLILLNSPQLALDLIQETISNKENEINGVFGWHPDIISYLTPLLFNSPSKSIAHILRYLAQDFLNRSTGFPDLMTIGDGKIKFYEIKAEGDSLKSSQLKQIIKLEEAGFEVQVLRVQYNVNPLQTYVVVDVETTGGRPGYHRIT